MKVQDYSQMIGHMTRDKTTDVPGSMAHGLRNLAIGPRGMVGEITEEQTQFGRPIYQTPAGEKVSEKSVTLFFNGDWMNVPSIHGGKSFNEDELRLMIKQGNLQPTSVHKSRADAEAAAKARSSSMVQGPRNMYNQGQLVQPSGDGSRPGYSGTIGAGLSLDRLSEYKSAEEFYNKSIKNHKYLDKNKKHKNPYYKKNWEKLKTWQRKSITDNIYKTSLTMDKVPDGYVAVQQWATENKIPSFTKQSGSKIDRISAALQRGEDGKYRSDINYIKENLKPIKLRTSGGNVPGLGVGNIQDRWYIKVDKNSKKNLLDFFDQRYLHSSTMNNINTFLDDKKLVKLLEKGDYKGIVARMESLPGSASVKSNALARIAQMMSGTKFKAFDTDIEVNKVNANKIFKGLSETRWGNPFFPAFRRLVMDTIQKEIGGDYFNKKYSTFVTDARKALTKQFGKKFMETMNINEITGMTSGFRGDTFNSTQFINLINKDFNQIQHANMLRWYGEAETNVANALKNNNRYKANQIIKKWDTWAQNWYKDLPPEYKTKAVKNTIPTFKVGVDPVKNIFSPERLAEMKKVKFDPRGDYIANQKLQLAKTFKTQADTPLLKEVASGDSKAMERIKAQLIALCPNKASGGRIGFKSAGAVLGSGANCGRNHMNNLLKNGTGTTEERNLIRQVMKAGFDFAKGTGKAAVNLLNPKEFLKLKNWVGGPAIALMGAAEGLDVVDRVVRQGIPIKEALGEKWTKFLMPKSLQEYQVEGMEEANALSSPASKRYAKGIKLSNDLVRAYDQLEMLEKGEAGKLRKTGDVERIAELKKLIRTKEKKYYDYLYQTDEKGNVLGDGELDFIKDYNEYRATTKKGRDFGLFQTSGRDFTDLDIFGGMSDMGTDKMSGLKIKKDYFPMYEIGTSKIPSEQELALDLTLAKKPFVRERLVPLKQLKDFKYQNKELPTQNRIDAENFFTDQGILPPRTSLSEVPLSGKENTYDLLKDLTDDYNRIQKFKEAREYPGFEGSQFSEGGITGLRSKYEYKK